MYTAPAKKHVRESSLLALCNDTSSTHRFANTAAVLWCGHNVPLGIYTTCLFHCVLDVRANTCNTLRTCLRKRTRASHAESVEYVVGFDSALYTLATSHSCDNLFFAPNNNPSRVFLREQRFAFNNMYIPQLRLICVFCTIFGITLGRPPCLKSSSSTRWKPEVVLQ